MPQIIRRNNPWLAPLDLTVLAAGWYVRTGPDELSRYRRWHALTEVTGTGIRMRCGRQRPLDWIDDMATPDTALTELPWISGWAGNPLTFGLGPPHCQSCFVV